MSAFSSEALLEEWQSSAGYRGQIVHIARFEPRPARYKAPAAPLLPPVARALAERGIERLYTHQARALDAVRAGEDVVVVTGTASGKSLCYQLPLLETLAADPQATALLLYPTKALAQDQERHLQALVANAPDIPLVAATYDGDTPPQRRRTVRERASAVLTNPDMLHASILPQHASWGHFLERLAFVVIDELHVYRGIFGSHVANVLRRLGRIAAHYGARPQYICTSATVGNPAELAEKLCERRFAVIDDDGAPRGPRRFVLWNPPRIKGMLARRSLVREATDLLTRLVRGRIQTIAFARSRLIAELLYRYTREAVARESPSLVRAIRAYRAGYLPQRRREIERELFGGELVAVASTSALELGIDVGGVDVALLVGFPGSVASTWQQAGRAGRKGSESLVILLGRNTPLDQYLMQHPEYFFRRTAEHVVLDPDNPHVIIGHLRAAIFELALSAREETMFGPYGPGCVRLLSDAGECTWRDERWHWIGKGFPAGDVDLRTAGERNYTIMLLGGPTGRPEAIGSADEVTAFTQLHDEAVYLHDGESFFVERLDTVARAAYVRPAALDYYTQAVTDRRVRIERIRQTRPAAPVGGRCACGDVVVTFTVFMYKKVRFARRTEASRDEADEDSLGYGRVHLPPLELETAATWCTVPEAAAQEVARWDRSPLEALYGVANVLPEVLPLFTWCDPSDVGALVDASQGGGPTLFVFDRYPGGAGFADRAFHSFESILAACCDLIEGCECERGCPSCVGAPAWLGAAGAENGGMERAPDKEAALILLHAWLGREPYHPKPRRPRSPAPTAEGAGDGEGSGPPRGMPLPAGLEQRLRERLRHRRSPA